VAEPELRDMGELSGGELYRLQLEDRLNEPRLDTYDPWGNRVDQIQLTRVWQRAAALAAERGVVGTAYERKHGRHSRPHQFALMYLFDPSTDTYTCPLAMTDGAASTLLAHGNKTLIERAIPRLTHRDPAKAWTSGQWMTERTGGSDVGLSETVALRAEDVPSMYGVDEVYRLRGTKWFTSAATSQMSLTLGRLDGAPAGGRGLTLFYLECFNDDGSRNGIVLNRLKDKLGTRKLPTAELDLDDCLAVPVAGTGHGVRNITPMLNITRTWNSMASAAAIRRGIALARDYARRRVQFGAPLSEKPLHLDTLAALQAEHEGALLLAFRLAELLGIEESGEGDDQSKALLRMVTSIAKLTTGKQAMGVISEVLECFGGAGYVEDTGVPRLLRDAQVLPIWEGTTNVLSLDLLRAGGQNLDFGAYERELERLRKPLKDGRLVACGEQAKRAYDHAREWISAAAQQGPPALETGARRFALTLGRSLELALVAHHAQWCLDELNDPRSTYAARRLAINGVDRIVDAVDRDETAALANDELPS
jgi:alkylation response protein AidB-like acyl-CoA dehydrogenase